VVFIDEAKLVAQAGSGGNGCVAFRREKFVPRGGPAGGDGGPGGSVLLVGDESLNTLFHLRHSRLVKAERGRHGEGSNRTGRSGKDVRVRVPLGTVVREAGHEAILGEVLEEGEELQVARGGRGGRGNARFKRATQQAPDWCEEGTAGEERALELELKLLADVGLVGLPNAGKSTLISVVSAARPKIADYAFTTLVPQLGVVALDAMRDPFVIADLPGLIAGAAEGAGLGHQFLRHIERCRVLVHLVDLSAEGAPIEADVAAIEDELRSFDPEILDRPRLLVGSKLDAAEVARRSELERCASRRGLACYEVSAVARQGLGELLEAVARMLDPGADE
jgi:GTP-binding protein